MKTIIKYAGVLYVAQASVGFIVGFAFPWLRFFGVL